MHAPARLPVGRMKPRTVAFAVVSLLLAGLFVRLGVWQLARLGERRALNEVLRQRMTAPPEAIATLSGAPATLRYQRARVSGRPDYDAELVQSGRSRNGSPGVHLLTPFVTPGTDTATLVVRGWVYSPDGAVADRSRWREGDSLTLEGWLETFPEPIAAPDSTPGRAAAVTRLDHARLERRIGRPLRRVYLMAVGDSAAQRADAPARFTLPPLDEGSHRGYAFQWFSFAAIAVVGAGLVIRNEGRATSRAA